MKQRPRRNRCVPRRTIVALGISKRVGPLREYSMPLWRLKSDFARPAGFASSGAFEAPGRKKSAGLAPWSLASRHRIAPVLTDRGGICAFSGHARRDESPDGSGGGDAE